MAELNGNFIWDKCLNCVRIDKCTMKFIDNRIACLRGPFYTVPVVPLYTNVNLDYQQHIKDLKNSLTMKETKKANGGHHGRDNFFEKLKGFEES